MEEMISVAEAAKRFLMSEQYLRRLLNDGIIPGVRIGKTWAISANELALCRHKPKKQRESDKPNIMKPCANSIKCLSFFSGAMGLDLGLEQAGISTLLASEIDNACRQTISINRPGIGLIGDIRNYTKDELFKMAGLGKNDDIDVVAGGPPCQAFSTAGKRKGFEDRRGNVFLYFVDLILDLRPKIAIIENVRGLLSAPLVHRPHCQRGCENAPLSDKELKGGALLYILDRLRNGGYSVSFNLYNAANFGAPQVRERVVLLCSRNGQNLSHLIPTHSENGEFGLPKWRTLRNAVEGLHGEHKFIKFPEKRLRYYRLLKSGQNWRNLPAELQQEALGKSYFSGGGKTGFLRRLDWDKPSPTLVTHPAMPATDLCHPIEDRPLSIEEYKRIQEFPDSWIVAGGLIDQYRQIGNAVPISLGRAIGHAVVDHLQGRCSIGVEGFSYSRYKDTDEESWQKNILLLQKGNRNSQQLSLPIR